MVETLKKDKEKLQIVNHDLRQFAPKDFDPDTLYSNDPDDSFADIKQRNVIEIMDLKARQLKKKNDMLVLENDNLRTELKLLCAADKDLHDDFTNSKKAIFCIFFAF